MITMAFGNNHIAVYMRASQGNTVKVRNIVPKVTDAVVD